MTTKRLRIYIPTARWPIPTDLPHGYTAIPAYGVWEGTTEDVYILEYIGVDAPDYGARLATVLTHLGEQAVLYTIEDVDAYLVGELQAHS
jgi:hypothetical protein